MEGHLDVEACLADACGEQRVPVPQAGSTAVCAFGWLRLTASNDGTATELKAVAGAPIGKPRAPVTGSVRIRHVETATVLVDYSGPACCSWKKAMEGPGCGGCRGCQIELPNPEEGCKCIDLRPPAKPGSAPSW